MHETTTAVIFHQDADEGLQTEVADKLRSAVAKAKGKGKL